MEKPRVFINVKYAISEFSVWNLVKEKSLQVNYLELLDQKLEDTGCIIKDSQQSKVQNVTSSAIYIMAKGCWHFIL